MGDATHLQPGPSPALAAGIVLVHGGGVWCLLAAEIPPTVIAIGVVLLGASFALGLAREALRTSRDAIVAVVRRADGIWIVTRRDGRTVECDPAGAAFVHPLLVVVVLRSRTTGASLPLCLCRDAVSPDAFRRLRVALRAAMAPAGRTIERTASGEGAAPR